MQANAEQSRDVEATLRSTASVFERTSWLVCSLRLRLRWYATGSAVGQAVSLSQA